MMRALLLAALAAVQSVAQPAPTAAPAPITPEPARILASYPHDTSAFTEGLLIDHGTLYESTGREGQSDIRRVDLTSGRVLARVKLPPALFGEGIVAWRKELFSVTWHGGQGFRWTLPALKRSGGFRYEGEGWAMTEDGHALILSDGTPVLRYFDPATQKVVRRLTVTLGGRPLERLNELEYVDGEILANIWMTRYIVRIDPADGHVRGVIDLAPLIAQVGATDRDSVPNGIAYDRAAHKLYVTGKNWPRLFEIALPQTTP
ncbi:glutaminyl-peptide cyclotransferase [Sphingomonas glacialis]|uniref:Glutaminyl-peptide cyclotransferase n=2 Tax=Sphingomonas glacialis TaxID=658225 RepID=A0A502FG61_9SPHN|nr:glutaminyl-peptide cyclotransferase [Sphingomonas glacialis]TPG48286.1 glutaminyl-peptide cyclotransferase [Sphingomonas glacialis]